MHVLTPKMRENIKNSYDYRCGLAILLLTAQEITKKVSPIWESKT